MHYVRGVRFLARANKERRYESLWKSILAYWKRIEH